jgi:hypothetical protein
MMDNQIFYLNGGGDEQYTPRKTVEIIIPYIQHYKDKIIWCPFDKEDSEFVKVLRENGFNVVYSHIDNGQDFFTYEPKNFDVILSNPPYKDKRKFIERAESFNKPWCLLLPINIISDAILNDIFGNMEELTILVPKRRTRFFNKRTGEIGKSPTFKACYIGRKFFLKQLIGVDN